jgi:hypothetical protein
MPEPMITTTAMHPMMNLPCGRHVWFPAQKLMLAQSLWVSQVLLWILFHFAACGVFCSGVCVGVTVFVSRLPKLRPTVEVLDRSPIRWGELSSWNTPPTPGIMETRVSSMLRSSVLLVALACGCLDAPSIIWPVNESFLCGGGLVGAPVDWPDLESVPMMAIPIIRQLVPQSDGEMPALICTMAFPFFTFFF